LVGSPKPKIVIFDPGHTPFKISEPLQYSRAAGCALRGTRTLRSGVRFELGEVFSMSVRFAPTRNITKKTPPFVYSDNVN